MTIQEWQIVLGAVMSAVLTLGPWMFMVHAKLAVLAARIVDLGEKVEKASDRNHELWTLSATTPRGSNPRRSIRPPRRTIGEPVMMIRDRIRELRRVRAGDLRPHPKNWRTHPPAQQDALRGVLAEIGYAAALLARELPDGSLQLIDGHLRAETTPDTDVPVLIVDLDDAETAKLLALHDPISAMAGRDDALLSELLMEVDTESEAIRAVLDGLLAAPLLPEDLLSDGVNDGNSNDAGEITIPESYQVVAECENESRQKELYERLTGEG